MHKKVLWLAVGLSLAVVSSSLIFQVNPPPDPLRPEPASVDRALPAFGALPAHFEPGHTEGEFVARRAGLAMTLGHEGARVHLADQTSTASLGLMLEGAAPRAARPENPLPGVSNYFLGEDPRAWRTGVPHYARIRYEEIYPGIDLVYYGNEGTLEYDFLVAPGADPSRIRMSYRGANDVRIAPNGDLRIELGSGALVHRKPVSFQRLPGGKRREVQSRFELHDGVVTFELGEWDRGLPLVIDPVLSFATYFGGSNDNEEIHAIYVDAAGDIYVAGHTNSPNLPVTAGAYQTTPGGQFDVFVSKFNSTGSTLLFSTYLGGGNLDMLHLMRVDATGNTYVAGETTSANFPVSAGAPQSTFGGLRDLFVAKLDPTGTALLYSTYLGGGGGEPASAMLGGLEVDVAGNAWIYSDTNSADFPVSAGAPQPARGNPNGAQFDQDVTLTRINATGTAFAFSTYHGGTGIESVGDLIDEGHLLGLDPAGNVWVAGTTQSADMPVTAAFDSTHNGPVNGGDFFITRFDAASGARTMSTYLGGTGNDLAESFAVDGDGDVFITGRATAGFPVTSGAADTTYNGGNSDIGIAKMGADVSVLAYASYLGGSSGESAQGLRIDSTGAAFVAGSTQSTLFPVTAGAADTTFNGGSNDGFIAKLNPSGSAFQYVTLAGSSDSDGVVFFAIDNAGGAYALLGDAQGDAFVSTGGFAYAGNTDDYFVKLNAAGTAFLDASYLGGGGDDYSLSLHVDAQQNLYLGGVTTSADFPTTPGTVQSTKPGPGANDDMYLVKFATTPDTTVAQPGTLALTAAAFNTGESGSASITVSRAGGSSGAVSVTCTASAQGGDTATAGTDFTATSFTLNWADGDTANKTCGVTIAGDTTDEPDETFTVTLSNVQGGATLGSPSTATVTILDDDAPPAAQPGTVQFDPGSYSANENGGSVTLTLTRTLGADGAISVNVASGGGSASAGMDYTALSHTVSWADGDSAAKTVTLMVLDDSADEQNETVTVTLSGATGGASVGSGTATVTIVDDDVPSSPPGPANQTSNVTGRYGGGGGVDGLLILGLALVLALALARARRVHRPWASISAIFATLACLSLPARAEEGWYAGLRAGVVETSQTATSIERALVALGHDVQVTSEDREAALTALGGYRWQNGLAVELGFSHLGEFDVAVAGDTVDPTGLLGDTHGLLAQAGQAVSASLAWNLRLGERVELTPRAGVSYWRSTREAESEAGRLRSRDDGVDLVAGITLSLNLDAAWTIGLGYESWPLQERNDLRVWQMSLLRRIR